MCKTQPTQNFCAPRLSWYSFGVIWWPIQHSHLKNHEFHFFKKLPTKPSSYAVVHRPTWPCAKPNQLKAFVHQDFHGIHLGAFGGQSNPHILKTTNFIFSQNSPPSHLAIPWPCAKPSELKTFVHQEFHGILLGTFGGLSNPHISKTTNFIFSQNSPPSHQPMSWCTYNLGHVQNPPNSKLLSTKTFMVFIWGHLEANPTLTSQKPRISFFHKPCHQAIYLCAKPTELKTFVVFIWGHLKAFPTEPTNYIPKIPQSRLVSRFTHPPFMTRDFTINFVFNLPQGMPRRKPTFTSMHICVGVTMCDTQAGVPST